MKRQLSFKSAVKWVGAGAAAAAGVYAGLAAVTWYRYGKPDPSSAEEHDELLDRFMPAYDVVERHHVRIEAPSEITLSTARNMDLMGTALSRAIFKARAVILGAGSDDRERPRGLLDLTRSLGWVVLDERPGREIVVGAVTRPWESKVTFRSVPSGLFASFAEPDYVKIAWTLRADPIDARTSVFRTETRAVATDADARRRFRRYWSLACPGISLIRWSALGPLKAAAERQANANARGAETGGLCANR